MSDAETTVAMLKSAMAQFIRERDWEQFHDPKNLSTSIAIEAAELMEHFQWLRSDELDQVRRDPTQMELIGEELAEITAFVLSFANAMQIDLSDALLRKMQKNALKYPAERYRGRFR
ncbi:MAG TPA: nucleotide pyrophosphohydrolase [Phycisphaerae bacterium]